MKFVIYPGKQTVLDRCPPIEATEVTVAYEDIHSSLYERRLKIDVQGVWIEIFHLQTGKKVRTFFYPHQDLIYQEAHDVDSD